MAERHGCHRLPARDQLLAIDAAIRKRSGGGLCTTQLKQKVDNLGSNPSILLEKSGANQSKSNSEFSSRGYEYLDHTADVQLHAFGTSLAEALEHLVLSMFNYLVDVEKGLTFLDIDEDFSLKVASNVRSVGHDLQSLIFDFLDQWLFIFHDTGFVAKQIEIMSIKYNEKYCIVSTAKGEKFNTLKHPQGTEIKAITYSNMHIKFTDGENDVRKCDVWVIVDI